VVGKKLKSYASKLLFQGSQDGGDNPSSSGAMMDVSASVSNDLDDIQSEHVSSPRKASMGGTDDSLEGGNLAPLERHTDHTSTTTATSSSSTSGDGSSGGGRLRPRKWISGGISAVKNRSSSLLMGSQSESNVHDHTTPTATATATTTSSSSNNNNTTSTGWRPGSNIRKLKNRLGRRNTTTAIPSTSAGMVPPILETPLAELSHGESSHSGSDVGDDDDNNDQGGELQLQPPVVGKGSGGEQDEGDDMFVNADDEFAEHDNYGDNTGGNDDGDDDDKSLGEEDLVESNTSDKKDMNSKDDEKKNNASGTTPTTKKANGRGVIVPAASPARSTILAAPSSKLKSKMQAPVSHHKFHESAKF